jgi:hypothetical protein
MSASTTDSNTPLPRKLGVEPGMRVALIGGPDGLAERLDGARVSHALRGSFELIVFFATSRRSLEGRLPALLRAREADGRLWLAWPRRSSGIASDLDDVVVRQIGLGTGLVDNKVCAIDETWSGLRFVARRSA